MKSLITSLTALAFSLSLAVTRAETTIVSLSIDDPHWQSLEYGKIPANQLEQSEKGFHINVNASASPLIYVFDKTTQISHIRIAGSLNALPIIPQGKKQGEKGADDFAFRIGLVVAGEQQLNFAQKLIAAEWVKTLYSLAPKGTGISHVQFLNLANVPGPDWQQREHPASKGLFKEQIVATAPSSGPFVIDHRLEQALQVVAFWISSDGDDTGSQYQIEIQHLAYQN